MVKSLPGEIWKDISGYKWIYQASNFGRFKALDRVYYLHPQNLTGERTKKEHLLKLQINSWGYATVKFMKHGKKDKRIAHRVIAELFIGEALDRKQVNHKDGNKLNNHASNLEWVSPSENSKHSYDIGLSKKKFGINHHNSKLVLDTQSGVFYESLKEASEAKGINISILSAFLTNKHRRKKNNTGLIYV